MCQQVVGARGVMGFAKKNKRERKNQKVDSTFVNFSNMEYNSPKINKNGGPSR